MSASFNDDACSNPEEDDTPRTPKLDEAYNAPASPPTEKRTSLDELTHVAARIKADGAQWRQEQYRVDSIRERLHAAIRQECVRQTPTYVIATEIRQREPVLAHQGGISKQITAPIATPRYVHLQPNYRPMQPLALSIDIPWEAQHPPGPSQQQPEAIWQKAAISVLIFLGFVYAISLGVSQVVMPPLIAHFLSATTMNLLMLIGSVGTIIGFILLGLESSTKSQRLNRLERRIAQIGVFVITSSLIGIYSNIMHLNFNNLGGSLLVLCAGGGCAMGSEYLIDHSTHTHRVLHIVKIGCFVCGVICWALPLGTLLAHTTFFEAHMH